MPVKLENTTDAAIYLPITMEETLTVPRAVKTIVRNEETGETTTKKTMGSASIDEARLEALKKNKVVAGYFAQKHLRVVGSGPPPDASTAVTGKAK